MIILLPPQDRWPKDFDRYGESLRATLREFAIRIDHIGSTAVPGIPAKDVIDIQISVAGLNDALDNLLASLGYARFPKIEFDHIPPFGPEDPEHWRKRFYYLGSSERRVNLHARLAGRQNERYALLFRDYLRTNSSAATAYGQIKLELARLHPEDIDAYYAVKDPVCDLVMDGAERWAKSVGWAPGESDQ